MSTAVKKNNRKRLVLLDSHAIIHRAYHALPDFTSSKGEPTGGLYGLSSMLLKLIDELKPDYIAACFDLAGPTHRHEVFDGYKAGRVKTEDALVMQIDRARDVLKAFGIPLYEAQGFEADDCLGTIVEQLKDRDDVEIIIASGDMDTLQLVDNDRVKVFTLRKGLSDTVTYDEDAVRTRFGFGPELIPDYKGLRGDPSDNIPGIKGIGEKAATDLILAFGGMPDIYETLKKHPEQFEKKGIKARVMKLVQEGEDDAAFSMMLATIRRDAPITFTLPKEPWEAPVDDMLTLFDELEFRSLGARARALFGGEQPAETPEEKEDETPIDPNTAREAAVALWLLSSDMTNPTVEDVLRYTKESSVERAHAALMQKLKDTGRLWDVFEKIERPLISIVERMHTDGIALDTAYLKKLSREYHTELSALEKRIFQHAGKEFNINSPAQLSVVLFTDLKLSIPRHKKTGTGKPSTRESEIEKLRDAHPIINDILAYRELQKLLSTYIDNMPEMVGEDGRLHPTFLQAGAATGRMASQNPGVQNIPIKTEYGRRMRNAFVAARGYQLIALDYSQIELRIAAGLSGDKKLIEVFKKGGDIHTAVASEVFKVPAAQVDAEMRRRAKVINFGIIYGMGVNALRANLGDHVLRDEAARFLQEYFNNFSGLAAFLEKTKRDAARNGYTETLFGRRRFFSGFKSPLPHIQAQAERMAVNAPIQGTQADITKLAMIAADAWIEKEKMRDSVRLLLQIHDELVFEVKKSEIERVAREMARIMETVVEPKELGGVPIAVTASVGENWGEMEKIKKE
ncbi:MAG: hypothetical protein HYT30_01235 [Parcubacteria group bacterium]|nr:hypothetical protein [Parcubacteria group bacterium]